VKFIIPINGEEIFKLKRRGVENIIPVDQVNREPRDIVVIPSTIDSKKLVAAIKRI
jgi:hypothetical protein